MSHALFHLVMWHARWLIALSKSNRAYRAAYSNPMRMEDAIGWSLPLSPVEAVEDVSFFCFFSCRLSSSSALAEGYVVVGGNVCLHQGHSCTGPSPGPPCGESLWSSVRKGVEAYFIFVSGPAAFLNRCTVDLRNSSMLYRTAVAVLPLGSLKLYFSWLQPRYRPSGLSSSMLRFCRSSFHPCVRLPHRSCKSEVVYVDD